MEQKKLNRTSAGRSEALRKARERVQAEVMKKAVDASTGSKGSALMALAAIAILPTADATGLIDLIDNAVDVPGPEEAWQASPRRRRRYL